MNRTVSHYPAILIAAQMSIHLPCATLFGKSHGQEETVADVQCKAVQSKPNRKPNQISNAQCTMHDAQRTWLRHTKKTVNRAQNGIRRFPSFHLFCSFVRSWLFIFTHRTFLTALYLFAPSSCFLMYACTVGRGRYFTSHNTRYTIHDTRYTIHDIRATGGVRMNEGP